MYKACKTEESQQRQKRFAEGLLSLLETTAWPKITVRQLCCCVNAPRNAFYRYFNTLDDALDLLIDQKMIWDYTSYVTRCANEQSGFGAQQEMEELFHYWYSKREITNIFEKNGLTGRMLERLVSHHMSDQTNAYHLRFGDNALKMNLAIEFSVFGLMALLLQWHKRGYQPDAAEMASYARQLMTQPLFLPRP